MKKALSVILSIVMIITIMPKLSTDVAAASYNAQTVISKAREFKGSIYSDKAKNAGITKGYCLGFVAIMFKQAYGFSYEANAKSHCAYEYGSARIVSTSRDNIPLGALVFFSGSKTPCKNTGGLCGHVGIYSGNGNIIHEFGESIVETSIEKVLNTGNGYNYGYRGWGWMGGVALGDGSTGTNPDDYPFPERDIYYKNNTAMKGDDVCWIQAALREIGYDINIDGSFGPASRDVVKRFQSDNGLSVDGSVGPATREAIKGALAWKRSTYTYTVTFNANGGTGSMSNASMTVSAAKNLPANTFTRSGYTFLGWSKSNVATSATYTDKQSVKGLAGKDGKVTLYAVWKQNTYTIAFNANNGTGSMSNLAMEVGTEKNLTANAFTRSGYAFLGWSTDKNATAAAYTDKQSVKDLATSGTVTLYAVWQKNASSTAPALSVTGTYGTIGKKLKISVNLNNASVGALDFDLVYDPKVLKYTGLSSVFAVNDCNEVSEGTVMVVGSSTSSEYTGKVVDIEFDVLAISDTVTYITVAPTNALKADGETEVVLKEVTAAVTISDSVKMGDINGDDKINSTDAMWVLQAAVKKRTLEGSQLVAADVNHDGKINSTDAMWILQAAVKKRTLS